MAEGAKNRMVKNVLVTGGCGYIGAHVVKALDEAEYTPIIYDNLSTGDIKSAGKHKMIIGDIRDQKRLFETFQQNEIDSVIHMAAKIDVEESIKNPYKYANENVQGSLNLFSMMSVFLIDKIVFSSSAAVYGENNIGEYSEGDYNRPKSMYGLTKQFIEEALKYYPVKHVSLRYFNVGGADPDLPVQKRGSHLIPNAIFAAKNNFPFYLYGTSYPTKDGTAIRDYIHVKDVADAHIKALQYIERKGLHHTFNIGSGSGVSVKEIINLVENITGKRINHLNTMSRREGDPAILIGRTYKAQFVLDWDPKYTIEDIIRSSIR